MSAGAQLALVLALVGGLSVLTVAVVWVVLRATWGRGGGPPER